jgi:hypothetical protein
VVTASTSPTRSNSAINVVTPLVQIRAAAGDHDDLPAASAWRHDPIHRDLRALDRGGSVAAMTCCNVSSVVFTCPPC